MDNLQIILDSLINGQGRQMVKQIDAENLYDFPQKKSIIII